MPGSRRAERADRCGWDAFERRDTGCSRARARGGRTTDRLRDPCRTRRSRSAARRRDTMSLLTRILQARSLLVAMHLPFVGIIASSAVTSPGVDSQSSRWSALPCVLAAGAIQVRHSLAAADGIRPRHWEWTLLLLVLITYLPAPLFTEGWPMLHWFLIASLLMLLPRRAALATAGSDAVGF